MAGQIPDPRLRAQFLFVLVGIVIIKELGEFDYVHAIGGQVLVQVTHIEGLHRAARRTVRQLAIAHEVGTEVTLHHRSFYRRDLMFGRILDEKRFRGQLRCSPVKETTLVWTGSHAETTANAAALVNEDKAVLSMVGCGHRANINAGGIHAVVAGDGHEIMAASRKFGFIDLNPLLAFGDVMPQSTRLGALGRGINGDAALALFQVDDHAPGASFLFRFRCFR